MIVVIDNGMGNIGSVANMLKKAGVKDVVVSGEAARIRAASALILPGVGAFDRGMENLAKSGLREVLHEKVVDEKTPILGICLGMQLFARGSEEGALPGLGWIPGDVVRFHPTPEAPRVPHMGWNWVEGRADLPLFAGFEERPRFYFVHSYYFRADREEDVAAWALYGHRFACGVSRGNVHGVQFHPEKSHRFGMRLLANYARMVSA